MLYLAYVQKNPDSGDKELCLLAYQKTDQLWHIVTSATVSCNDPDIGEEGNLVLVKLTEDQQIVTIENAKDWVIGLVKEYLSYPTLTPEWVEKEKARIEQGRQEITAKSLDLTRRQLELETQREQIQALENQLKKNLGWQNQLE
jgi:polyhydroxyalkanoate synthesis regulator phasin